MCMFNKNHQKWRVRDNFRQTTLYITSIYRLSHSDDFFYQNTHTCVRSTKIPRFLTEMQIPVEFLFVLKPDELEAGVSIS